MSVEGARGLEKCSQSLRWGKVGAGAEAGVSWAACGGKGPGRESGGQ